MLARHWRIVGTQMQNGGANFALSEIQWRAVAGGADLTAVGGPATASSIYAAGYEAAKAFDDNAATFWHSANSLGIGAWVAYDFGADVEPVELYLAARNDSSFAQACSSGRIEYSADGITWTDYKWFSGLVYTTGSSNLVAIPLAAGTPAARVSLLAAEVLNSGGTSAARVSMLAVEVLRALTDAPPSAPSRIRQITF